MIRRRSPSRAARERHCFDEPVLQCRHKVGCPELRPGAWCACCCADVDALIAMVPSPGRVSFPGSRLAGKRVWRISAHRHFVSIVSGAVLVLRRLVQYSFARRLRSLFQGMVSA